MPIPPRIGVSKSIFRPVNRWQRAARWLAVLTVIQAVTGALVVTAQYRARPKEPGFVSMPAAPDSSQQYQIDRLSDHTQDLTTRVKAIEDWNLPVDVAVLKEKVASQDKKLDLLLNLIYGTLGTVIAGVIVQILDMRGRAKENRR